MLFYYFRHDILLLIFGGKSTRINAYIVFIPGQGGESYKDEVPEVSKKFFEISIPISVLHKNAAVTSKQLKINYIINGNYIVVDFLRVNRNMWSLMTMIYLYEFYDV